MSLSRASQKNQLKPYKLKNKDTGEPISCPNCGMMAWVEIPASPLTTTREWRCAGCREGKVSYESHDKEQSCIGNYFL